MGPIINQHLCGHIARRTDNTVILRRGMWPKLANVVNFTQGFHYLSKSAAMLVKLLRDLLNTAWGIGLQIGIIH